MVLIAKAVMGTHILMHTNTYTKASEVKPVASVTESLEKPQADPIQLNRLLQLCSANLPVGGFSFSQGLEYAVEMGWLVSPETTASWININLAESIAQTD